VAGVAGVGVVGGVCVVGVVGGVWEVGGVRVTPQEVDGPAQPQARQRAESLGPSGELSRSEAPLCAAAAVDAHVRKRRRGHGRYHRQSVPLGRRRRGGGTRRATLPLWHLRGRGGVAWGGVASGAVATAAAGCVAAVVGWVALTVSRGR